MIKTLLAFLVLISSALSQTPVLQLDASALSLSNNDPVSTWTDSSASGNDAIGTTSKRPLFKTSIINDLPAILFDGVDDVLQLGTQITPNGATVYVVCKPQAEVTDASSEALIASTGPAPLGALFLGNWTAGTTGEIVSVIHQPEPGFAHIATRTENLPATWVIISFRVGSGGVNQSWNGFQKSLTTGGTGLQPNDTTRRIEKLDLIGANAADGSSSFNGYIAEVRVYDSYLSDSEYRGVISTLASKYAITTPTLTPASLSEADIAISLGWAIPSDTVQLPAGTSPTWTTGAWFGGVSIPAGVHLKGAGIGQTILKTGITVDSPMIAVNGGTGLVTRVSDLEIQSDGAATAFRGVLFLGGTADSYLTAPQFRIFNILFDGPPGNHILAEDALGVVDHCTFNGNGTDHALFIFHKKWGGWWQYIWRRIVC